MAIEVRGAVKLLPTEDALKDGLSVEYGVTVEVVGPVEALAAALAEKLLVLWVGVREYVVLELGGAAEHLAAELAGDEELLAVVPGAAAASQGLAAHGLSVGSGAGHLLYERQALRRDAIPP